MDEFFKQAGLNTRAIWLMMKRNPQGARLIETDQMAIRRSILALGLSFLATVAHDYLAYPSNLTAGLISEDVTQNQFILGNLLIFAVVTLFYYYLIYLILGWLGRGETFPAVFVAFNWFALFVAVIGLLVIHIEVFAPQVYGLLEPLFIVLFLAYFYAIYCVQKHVSDLSSGTAIAVVFVTILFVIPVSILLLAKFGLLVLSLE